MKENIVKLLVDADGTQTEITGWTRINITRGIERIPNSFDLQMTEKVPDLNYIEVLPGMKCKVMIDDDVVITGFVDRFIPTISGNQHLLQVTGRGICCDLVDCSAVWQGMQFQNVTALQVAEKLCKPFGINVTSDIETTPITVQNINIGETTASVLERICRVSQLLYYENENGDLVLSRESKEWVSGSLEQGVNVEQASYNNSIDQRYSDYTVVFQNAAIMMDVMQKEDANIGFYTVRDATVKRPRILYIVPEEGDAGFTVALERANWEMKRRLARSQMVFVTTSIWRDSDENVWRPNTQLNINIPKLKIVNQTWLIGDVTYRKDETGTHCDMVLMPIGAFTPQPMLALPMDKDVLAAYMTVQDQGGRP